MSLKEELLQGFVELPDDFFFGDADIALKSFHNRVGRCCYRIRQLGLATPWWALDQQRFVHPRCQIHYFQGYRIDYVACGAQLFSEFSCGQEHVGFLPA